MYENKKMYKNEGLQKQNKANRRGVMERNIGGFCHGDIAQKKRKWKSQPA